ncbi:hypothetical protein RRG08_009020 [Elysia crispata]|uniref:Uncharacterized protein n=1 Tax=Elysia crispata TaxID=231223 RepID=A0AAE1AI63_9GAST|nr:hypothetical protein RRG08_009020 [Elysia crispata]
MGRERWRQSKPQEGTKRPAYLCNVHDYCRDLELMPKLNHPQTRSVRLVSGDVEKLKTSRFLHELKSLWQRSTIGKICVGRRKTGWMRE